MKLTPKQIADRAVPKLKRYLSENTNYFRNECRWASENDAKALVWIIDTLPKQPQWQEKTLKDCNFIWKLLKKKGLRT